MQPHLRLGLALPAPQGPVHPRQCVKEAAVLNEPLPPERFRRCRPLHQLVEDFFQNGRLQQMLGLRETSQAHPAAANLLLQADQLAGGAQPPHGAHHGIEQAEEKQAQIILGLEQTPLVRPAGGAVGGWPHLGQTRFELDQQVSVMQVAFFDFWSLALHASSKTNPANLYKLQSSDKPVAGCNKNIPATAMPNTIGEGACADRRPRRSVRADVRNRSA